MWYLVGELEVCHVSCVVSRESFIDACLHKQLNLPKYVSSLQK